MFCPVFAVFPLLSLLVLRGRRRTLAPSLLSGSPAGSRVSSCPRYLRGRRSTIGVLSFVCVAGVRFCRGVFRLLFLLVFARQAQHLGVLSVVCVAGGLSRSLDRSLVLYG